MCTPATGKSSVNHEKVLDMESSRYLYSDDLIDTKYNGNAELAKGDPDRVLREDGLDYYVEQIVKEFNSDKYDYILVSSHEEFYYKLLNKGILPYYVQHRPTDTLPAHLDKTFRARKNSERFINRYVPHCIKYAQRARNYVSKGYLLELEIGEYISERLELTK